MVKLELPGHAIETVEYGLDSSLLFAAPEWQEILNKRNLLGISDVTIESGDSFGLAVGMPGQSF